MEIQEYNMEEMVDSGLVGYVCTYDDLDKRLNSDLTKSLHQIFYDFDENGNEVPKDSSWRMFQDGMTPYSFFEAYGFDFNNPTVRLGVLLDLIKLDDASVSNDNEYDYGSNSTLSPLELERKILHRNYRVNLVNLEPEWSKIHYLDGSVVTKRSTERVWQGIKVSDTFLGYLNSLFESTNYFDSVYVPMLDSFDVVGDVGLISNVHSNFPGEFGRSYYDQEYLKYKEHLKGYGILNMSSYALVDSQKGKNHTGQYLIRVMKRLEDGFYGYLTIRVGVDGNICKRDDGKLDIFYKKSSQMLMACVCEGDYRNKDMMESSETWSSPTMKDIPMETSTTSSHYSVFMQRIPDYDLKNVRNYRQFKNRLNGMELCLNQLKSYIARKKIKCSEIMVNQVFSLNRLVDNFIDNKDNFGLLEKSYNLVAQGDEVKTKITLLTDLLNDKKNELNSLLNEYNEIQYDNLDRKMELGQKIKTFKLDIKKVEVDSLEFQVKRLGEIEQELNELAKSIRSDSTYQDLSFLNDLIDKDAIHDLILESERNRNHMMQLAFELNQMRKMLVMCDDATIKVRRLVHNFEQMVSQVESDIWDSNRNLKNDVNFNKIAIPGIRKIILLYDWYGYNAQGKTYDELGFANENEFNEFMEKCKRMSLELRKNKYSRKLAAHIMNLQDSINSLGGKIEQSGSLRYHDKYGKDGQDKDDGEHKWSVSDVSSEQSKRVSKALKYEGESVSSIRKVKQYEKDKKKLKSRTIRYLKDIGLIDQESDIEKLATRNASMNYQGDIQRELNKIMNSKKELDGLNTKMFKQREQIQSILDKLLKCQKTICELESQNKEILRECKKLARRKSKKSDAIGKSLLVTKMNNEQRIIELKELVKKTKKDNEHDISGLEKIRKEIDKKQEMHDELIRKFNEEIGVNEETIDNLIVGIYNQNQDQILSMEEH